MANCATVSGVVVEYWDAEAVRAALKAAGITMMRLRSRGCWPAGFRSAAPEPVLSWSEQYAAVRERIALSWERPSIAVTPERMRPPVPAPDEITLLDQVQGWICLTKPVAKRIALLALMHGASLRALAQHLSATGIRACSHVTAAKIQREAVDDLTHILHGYPLPERAPTNAMGKNE